MSLEIEQTIKNLQAIEFGQKALTAENQLRARLTELAKGKSVPIVIFNCLEFSWIQQRKDQYPKASVVCTPQLSICKYFAEEIEIVRLESGEPNVQIIIPDSELLDERVFPFVNSRTERLLAAQNAKIALTRELTAAFYTEPTIMLWSEYCQKAELKTPADYTKENRRRIEKESGLQDKVRKQIRDSKQFFGKAGIDLNGVNNGEVFNRIAWYAAMYMGEGQALAESGAICINLEDSRVPFWFTEGARGQLPTLNPVDSKTFYQWRATNILLKVNDR